MHYYDFNVGDYRRDTIGLSVVEDCAYRRIIDSYHLNEHALNGCSTIVAKLIGMSEHAEAVDYILRRFFREENGSWIHDRIEATIGEYRRKQILSVKAGKASGKRRRELANKRSTNVQQTFSKRSANVEPTNNHKPITINHEQKEKTISRAAHDATTEPEAFPPDGLRTDPATWQRLLKTDIAWIADVLPEIEAKADIEFDYTKERREWTSKVKALLMAYKRNRPRFDGDVSPRTGGRKTTGENTIDAGKRIAQKIYSDAVDANGGKTLCISSKN